MDWTMEIRMPMSLACRLKGIGHDIEFIRLLDRVVTGSGVMASVRGEAQPLAVSASFGAPSQG